MSISAAENPLKATYNCHLIFLSTTADKSDLIDVEFQLQFFFFFSQLLLKVPSSMTVDNTRPLPGSFRETRKSCIQLRDFFFERQLKPFYVLSVTAFLIEIRKWALKIFSKSVHVGGHGFDSFQ